MNRWILPLVLVLTGFAPLQMARAAEPIDLLFERLYETENPIEAQQLERKIWEAWATTDSDTLNTLLQSGVQLTNKGELARAEAIFSAMIDLRPTFAEAFNKRATVRFLAGNYPGSVADVERALRLEPRHFGALSGLGIIMEKIDNLPEAIRAYRRALAANPHLAGLTEKLKELRRKQDAQQI